MVLSYLGIINYWSQAILYPYFSSRDQSILINELSLIIYHCYFSNCWEDTSSIWCYGWPLTINSYNDQRGLNNVTLHIIGLAYKLHTWTHTHRQTDRHKSHCKDYFTVTMGTCCLVSDNLGHLFWIRHEVCCALLLHTAVTMVPLQLYEIKSILLFDLPTQNTIA